MILHCYSTNHHFFCDPFLEHEIKMPVVNPEKLVALQRNPDGIRNVSYSMEGYLEGSKATLTVYADLYISPRCKCTVSKCGTVHTDPLTGSWENFPYRRAPCHKRHYFPKARGQDTISRFSTGRANTGYNHGIFCYLTILLDVTKICSGYEARTERIPDQLD